MTDRQHKILEKFPVAIATVSNGSLPHVAVVAYVKVLDDNHLVITQNYLKKTVENLKEDPHVCLVVWDENWSGVRVYGVAQVYSSGEYLDLVKKMPENADENPIGAIVVDIQKIEDIE